MLGERLRKLRGERDLTQETVSNILGINRARYTQYELGTRNPDLNTLKKLADFYNTSTDYLIGHSDMFVAEPTPIYEINNNDLFKVPIVGTIRCGDPILADHNIEGYMYVDKSIARVNSKDKLFYLRVVGDSMAPKFQPDDLVLIRQQSAIDDGEIAVVLIDHEEATLKKVFSSNGTVWLHSLNPAYEPMRYKAQDVQIIGKALLRVGTV